MEDQALQSPLNATQREILKLFIRDLEEEDLRAIKRLIVKYLAERTIRMADEVWDEKGWNNEEMDRLAHSHLRTPYTDKE